MRSSSRLGLKLTPSTSRHDIPGEPRWHLLSYVESDLADLSLPHTFPPPSHTTMPLDTPAPAPISVDDALDAEPRPQLPSAFHQNQRPPPPPQREAAAVAKRPREQQRVPDAPTPKVKRRQHRHIPDNFFQMDRFDVVRFQDLSGPNGGEWVRIGGGSFGVVYKGEYLGTPVAIKEVLPNNTYDVEKYFERECVLMKEARHPNIAQYIGLTKSPGQDGRIYIISEFVGGNVRSYIADKRKPFGWRLRMSFAMDIARALAYLHARNCMHRDLKGENLL